MQLASFKSENSIAKFKKEPSLLQIMTLPKGYKPSAQTGSDSSNSGSSNSGGGSSGSSGASRDEIERMIGRRVENMRGIIVLGFILCWVATAGVKTIEEIMNAVSIPIMAKCRIGHYSEAKMLETCGVDMIDESEVLTPADEENHIWKWEFTTPFVNGAKNLGEALRRIEEGASMIRTKGEPGTGNVAEAVNHIRKLNKEIRLLKAAYLDNDYQEIIKVARDYRVSMEVASEVGRLGRLPIVNFAAGGITTPADASFLMKLGCDGVFVGSGIFKSDDPSSRAKAVVLATTFYDNEKEVLEAQKMIDEKKSLIGLDTKNLDLRMQERGPAV